MISVIPDFPKLFYGYHPSLKFLIAYLIQIIVLFLPMWVFVIRKYKTNLADFGFKKIALKKMLFIALGSYVFYLILATLITTILFSNNLDIPGYHSQASYIELFGSDRLGITVAILVIVILAPIIEEFFFRGFVYRILTKIWPVWLGSLMTAIMFAAVHFQLESFFPILLLGLFLNFTYQKSGSLWTSITFHSLNNAIALAIDIYIYFHPELLKSLELVAGFH